MAAPKSIPPRSAGRALRRQVVAAARAGRDGRARGRRDRSLDRRGVPGGDRPLHRAVGGRSGRPQGCSGVRAGGAARRLPGDAAGAGPRRGGARAGEGGTHRLLRRVDRDGGGRRGGRGGAVARGRGGARTSRFRRGDRPRLSARGSGGAAVRQRPRPVARPAAPRLPDGAARAQHPAGLRARRNAAPASRRCRLGRQDAEEADRRARHPGGDRDRRRGLPHRRQLRGRLPAAGDLPLPQRRQVEVVDDVARRSRCGRWPTASPACASTAATSWRSRPACAPPRSGPGAAKGRRSSRRYSRTASKAAPTPSPGLAAGWPARRCWTPAAADAMRVEVEAEIRAAVAAEQAIGPPPASALIEQVLARPSAALEEQLAELDRARRQ